MRIVRPVVRTVGTVAAGVRDINRLREVAAVLVRHGFGFLFANVDMPGLVLGRLARQKRFSTNPDRAVAAVQELGVTFIKLGQVLSTRSDVIPSEYVEAFQQLQDDVTPLPFWEIENQMSRELGPDWRSTIAEFDDSPLATASIAQVHRARLKSGQQVVFKVQRPHLGVQIRSDLSILQFLVNRLIVEFPEAALFDPHGILEQFERSILAEVDFKVEAENTLRFGKNFQGDEHIRIPALYPELCTARVLCLEFMDGIKIRHARERGCDMAVVGHRYLHASYEMLFAHGFFHGDLHPGNVLVLPGDRLGLLDFGMVGRLTRDMQDHVVTLIFALERGDFRTISRVFFDIAIKEGRVDYDAFERDALEVVSKNWEGVNFQSMQIGRFLQDLAWGALRHNVRAPPNYTMFFKALLTTEGLAKSLIPEVDPLAAARPWVEKLISERYSSKRVKEDMFYTAVTLGSLARRLPTSLSQFLDDLDHHRVHLDVTARPDAKSEVTRERRQARGVLAALSITAAVCGSLSLDAPGAVFLDIPVLAWIFYAVALPLFLITLWAVWRG
jgi:ubiquinone biosynthesis protein